jgi:hypothetical protein
VQEARLLRHWPDTYIYRQSVSADGKRMVFLKRVSEQTVFRRGNQGWEASASKTCGGWCLRNARPRPWLDTRRSGGGFEEVRRLLEISRQKLNSVTPELLVNSQEMATYGRFTPDGSGCCTCFGSRAAMPA